MSHATERVLDDLAGMHVVIDRDWWADDEPPSQEERDEWRMHENQDVLFDASAYDDYDEGDA